MLPDHRAAMPVASGSQLESRVLYAESTDAAQSFDAKHLEVLLGIATVAAIAIEHATQMELLEARNKLPQDDEDARHQLMGGGPTMLSSAASKILEHYDWPGNVRELQNVIERAVLLSENGILLPAQFPVYLHKPGVADPDTHLKELEDHRDRDALKAALIKSGGDVGSAARMINNSVATTYRWINDFGLSDLLKSPRGKGKSASGDA